MQIIDLSHPFYEGMPQYREKWCSSPRVSKQIDSETGKSIFKLDLIASSGTHIKAPKFQRADLRSIEHLSMKELFHYATVIHLSEKREKGLITFEDLQAFYIKPGDGVVIHTGWSTFWESGQYYIDFPLITSDAAEYLVLEKNISFLGADAPFSNEVQQVILENDRFLIENLTNLDRINLNRFFLIALPLNIYSSDAAPARVVAVENDNLIV
ncbi:cyclase family protein [candidate division KSB1 bacterium]|nr:cyclase family protein [candidate division KSB1 bacterium]